MRIDKGIVNEDYKLLEELDMNGSPKLNEVIFNNYKDNAIVDENNPLTYREFFIVALKSEIIDNSVETLIQLNHIYEELEPMKAIVKWNLSGGYVNIEEILKY